MSERLTKDQVSDLRSALRQDYGHMEPFRRNRREALEICQGDFHTDKQSREPRPMNFLKMAVDLFRVRFAAAPPHVWLKASRTGLDRTEDDFAYALNIDGEKTDFAEFMFEIAPEALFSVGIAEIGIKPTTPDAEWDPGEMFVTPRSLDDFVWDMGAKRRKDCRFVFVRDRLPIEEIHGNPLFNREARLKVKPVEERGGWGNADSAQSILLGRQPRRRFGKYGEIWKGWAPREGRYVFLTGEDQWPPLRDVPWTGPEDGPLEYLFFDAVPDINMPLPLVANWRYIERAGNGLLSKTIDQALAHKVNPVYSGIAQADAKNLRDAKDGEWIEVSHPDLINRIVTGGYDPNSLLLFLQLKQLYSYSVGNMEAIGGLGKIAETFGASKLIAGQANERVKFMDDRGTRFVVRVLRQMGFYRWYDPLSEVSFMKEVPRARDAKVDGTFNSWTRQGEFRDYKFNIRAGSMRYLSGEEQLEKMGVVMQNYVAPYLPGIQAQGGMIDFEQYTDEVAELSDCPSLRRFIMFGDPADLAQGGQGGEQAPRDTHSVYERRGNPGMTQAGQEQALMQRLAGKQAEA